MSKHGDYVVGLYLKQADSAILAGSTEAIRELLS